MGEFMKQNIQEKMVSIPAAIGGGGVEGREGK